MLKTETAFEENLKKNIPLLVAFCPDTRQSLLLGSRISVRGHHCLDPSVNGHAGAWIPEIRQLEQRQCYCCQDDIPLPVWNKNM